MPTALVVSALCLLLLGTIVGVRAVRATRARHWLGGTIQGLVALLLLALAALAATVTVGLQSYRALTFEEVAATVRTEPVAPQRFRATITLPDRRLAMYELAGAAPHRVRARALEAGGPLLHRAAPPAWAVGGRGVWLRHVRRREPARDVRGAGLDDRSARATGAGSAGSLRKGGRMLVLKLIQSLIKTLHSEGTPG